MATPESSGIEKWAQWAISAILGAFGAVLTLARAWGKVERTAIAAGQLSEANAAMRDRDDLRIQALERNEAAVEARFTALLRGHERIESKLDRLTERLGG